MGLEPEKSVIVDWFMVVLPLFSIVETGVLLVLIFVCPSQDSKDQQDDMTLLTFQNISGNTHDLKKPRNMDHDHRRISHQNSLQHEFWTINLKHLKLPNPTTTTTSTFIVNVGKVIPVPWIPWAAGSKIILKLATKQHRHPAWWRHPSILARINGWFQRVISPPCKWYVYTGVVTHWS